MGRSSRLYIEGGLYHIVTRGNNRKAIFKEDSDYSSFLSTLLQLKQKSSFNLYAYCLMPNHFHLLMDVKSKSTSEVMQRLLTAYTKYFNKKYKKTGHLFQGRYKAIICEKDSYLLELVRYIHLNPYRAGLARKPADWKWSGHKEYLGLSNKKLIDIGEVLGMFSCDLNQAVMKYSEFVRDGCAMGKRKDFYPDEKMPYLGGKRFIEDLMIRYLAMENKSLPELRVRTKDSLNGIAAKVGNKLNVSLKSLCGKVRIKELANARKEFIINAVDSGYKGIEIARFLDCSQSYITKLVSEACPSDVSSEALA